LLAFTAAHPHFQLLQGPEYWDFIKYHQYFSCVIATKQLKSPETWNILVFLHFLVWDSISYPGGVGCRAWAHGWATPCTFVWWWAGPGLEIFPSPPPSTPAPTRTQVHIS